ncbi:hypothetical protein R75465_06542 [Paraburkholderia aspalathi]|nr:hypothetical protein R75465_06542 [Paraburkholderia aspalathi]
MKAQEERTRIDIGWRVIGETMLFLTTPSPKLAHRSSL